METYSNHLATSHTFECIEKILTSCPHPSYLIWSTTTNNKTWSRSVRPRVPDGHITTTIQGYRVNTRKPDRLIA